MHHGAQSSSEPSFDSTSSSTELDPIATLQVPSAVASIAFLSSSTIIDDDENSTSSSDDEDYRSMSRCAEIQQQQRGLQTSYLALKDQKLASLHKDGSCRVWDLNKRMVEATIDTHRPRTEERGLAIRRMSTKVHTDLLMIQTQQGEGTISIHAYDRPDFPVVAKYSTFSQTFCQATPCSGREETPCPLLAVPCRQETSAMIWDIRDPKPVTEIPISDEGMVTSLGLTVTPGTNRPVMGCGMESGSLILHDFTSGATSSTKAKINVSKDPILAMDMISSVDNKEQESIIALAGLAGDRSEEQELDPSDRGRIAVVKGERVTSCWDLTLESRLSTCRVHDRSMGKPGVSVCRFRPDGKVWAVGGWDYRVRLYDSLSLSPLAILRGHKTSVSALDFAADSKSGLLATSGTDNLIQVWKCFARN